MSKVLFTSHKSLERAENIKTVFDAYDGEKAFARTDNWRINPDMTSFKLRVADEYITASPGKAIFIGHGFGAGKTGGLDQPHPYYSDRYASLLDYIVTTSEEMIPIVARQTGVPESRILPLGMPRTDIYLASKKGDGGTFLKDKRAYLYVPTWRARGETPLPSIDWRYIESSLTDDEVFVVKSHPMTGNIPIAEYKHIVQISSKEPSTPYMIDCDVVITDYSSILFDAHLLRKPLILFEKNRGYLSSRGMYFQYPDCYSSRYCRTESELVRMMKTASGQNKEDLRCIERFASACDGHSTERVIRLMESLL